VSAPALAVVDVKLRDGMAYRLIDRLNELGILAVVVTGFATFSEPLAKAAAIVQKPVVKDEILAALCGVLPAILQ
jgi:ActR/RegA family two-component response regulator